MSDKDDVLKAVGKEVLKGAREGGAALAGTGIGGEKLSGNAKVLNDLLDEVVAQNQVVTIMIWRKGFGVNSSTEEFIKPLYNVNPEMLRDSGLEPMIQNYCGGGTYRVLLKAPGLSSKSVSLVIAGEPLTPKPEKDLQSVLQGGQIPFGMPMPVPGGGFNMATPGAYQYLGMPQPGQQGQSQSHTTDMMLLFQMLSSMQKPASSSESDESKMLREQIAELKAQNARAEQEKLHLEAERKHDAQLAELNAKLEKMATPKEDKLVALAPIAVAALGEFMKSRESSQAAQLAMMTAMLGTQKEASNESIKLFQSILAKPSESETDRMAKVLEIVTSSMSTTMGLTQALVNQAVAMQPGDPPWWQQAILSGIEQIGSLGQAVMESRSHKVTPKMTDGNVQVLPPSQDDSPPELMAAAAAAANAAQQQLATPTDGMVPQGEDAVAGMTEASQEVQLPDFSAGAFQIIFEKIQADAADSHEIAFRVWKHASSGSKEAIDWVRHPEEYTIILLDTMAQQGKLLVTAERIDEIAEAMLDLYEHFLKGGTAQTFVKRFNINLSLPKRVHVEPLAPEMAEQLEAERAAFEDRFYGEEGKEAGVAEVEHPAIRAVEDAEVVEEAPKAEETEPQPEAPKEPTVSTPTFGGSPPPKQ